jgi:hypothetical protein
MRAYFTARTLAIGRTLVYAAADRRCVNAMQLVKQCEFSGIFHRYIIMGDSAKVRTLRMLLQLSAKGERRARLAISCACPCPADWYPRFGHFVRIDRRMLPLDAGGFAQIAVSMARDGPC